GAVAVEPARQLDDEHEPATHVTATVGTGQLEALDPGERVPVGVRYARPLRKQSVEPLELRETERAGDVRQAVVEAEAVVVEPVHVGGAALVALRVDALL